MAVFQVLPEVIGAEEFLGLVALAEFVDVVEMVNAFFPIGLWYVGEFFATIATDVNMGEFV